MKIDPVASVNEYLIQVELYNSTTNYYSNFLSAYVW
jgi:hypothetical protein